MLFVCFGVCGVFIFSFLYFGVLVGALFVYVSACGISCFFEVICRFSLMIMGLYDLAVASLFNGCFGVLLCACCFCVYCLLICFSFDYVGCLFCCFSGLLGWGWVVLNDYA